MRDRGTEPSWTGERGPAWGQKDEELAQNPSGSLGPTQSEAGLLVPGRPEGSLLSLLPWGWGGGEVSELPRGLSHRLAGWASGGLGHLPASLFRPPFPSLSEVLGRDSDLGGGCSTEGSPCGFPSSQTHAGISVSALVSASLSLGMECSLSFFLSFPLVHPRSFISVPDVPGLAHGFCVSASVSYVSVQLRFSLLPFPSCLPRARSLCQFVPLSSFLGRPGSPSMWAGLLQAGPDCLPETLSLAQAALCPPALRPERTCLSPRDPPRARRRGGACAPSGAQGAERRGGPAPSRVPARAPPTVSRPQSRRCRPMNGVAFCLVGIPPRSEPRPPQVRRSARGGGPGTAGALAVGPGRGAPARQAQPRAQGAGRTAGTAAGGTGCWGYRLLGVPAGGGPGVGWGGG